MEYMGSFALRREMAEAWRVWSKQVPKIKKLSAGQHTLLMKIVVSIRIKRRQANIAQTIHDEIKLFLKDYLKTQKLTDAQVRAYNTYAKDYGLMPIPRRYITHPETVDRLILNKHVVISAEELAEIVAYQKEHISRDYIPDLERIAISKAGLSEQIEREELILNREEPEAIDVLLEELEREKKRKRNKRLLK